MKDEETKKDILKALNNTPYTEFRIENTKCILWFGRGWDGAQQYKKKRNVHSPLGNIMVGTLDITYEQANMKLIKMFTEKGRIALTIYNGKSNSAPPCIPFNHIDSLYSYLGSYVSQKMLSSI